MDTGADTGMDTGADTGVDTGVDTGADKGADTGVDTGADTGVETGADIGAETGLSIKTFLTLESFVAYSHAQPWKIAPFIKTQSKKYLASPNCYITKQVLRIKTALELFSAIVNPEES